MKWVIKGFVINTYSKVVYVLLFDSIGLFFKSIRMKWLKLYNFLLFKMACIFETFIPSLGKLLCCSPSVSFRAFYNGRSLFFPCLRVKRRNARCLVTCFFFWSRVSSGFLLLSPLVTCLHLSYVFSPLVTCTHTCARNPRDTRRVSRTILPCEWDGRHDRSLGTIRLDLSP